MHIFEQLKRIIAAYFNHMPPIQLNSLKTRRMKWVAPVIIAFVIIGLVFYNLSLPASGLAHDTVVIKVVKGMTTKEISVLLEEQGLIKSALFFRVIARMDGLDNSLQAGEYSFDKSMSVSRIVEKLAKGDSAYRQLTIPEGYTINQIAELVETKGLGSSAKFRAIAANYSPYEYMNTPRAVNYKAEGFVFPDTYRLPTGNFSEEQLLKIMVDRFDEQFTPAMRKQANELGLSINQVIVLASLVEREARVEKDRPVIAGVFIKRLALNMPLQSCATIQYILGYQKPELTIQDTELPSPYNTYQNSGLPPGPIANPGLASIKAVLNPAQTDYLYFVADKDGSHHFSKTYAEHLAAIEKARN